MDRKALPTGTAVWEKTCITLFPAIVDYQLKRYATGEYIATVEDEIYNLEQDLLRPADYAKRL